jgi:hypothetical protein
MKTVLIPTDFELASLKYLPEVTNRYYPQKLNIVLVHMIKMTDSITELLMLSRRRTEYKKITPEFLKVFNDFKTNHSDVIENIRIEFFYGSTVAAFKNFLEANAIEEVINVTNYEFKLPTKQSIDPTALINKCGQKTINIDFSAIKKPSVTATKVKAPVQMAEEVPQEEIENV